MHGMGMVYYFTMTTPDVNLPKNWKLNFQEDIKYYSKRYKLARMG
jgi:hypothetical protein